METCRLCRGEAIAPWPPEAGKGPTHHTCHPECEERFAVPPPRRLVGTNVRLTVNGVEMAVFKEFTYNSDDAVFSSDNIYVLKNPGVAHLGGSAVVTGSMTGWRWVKPFRVKRGRGQRRSRRNPKF